MSRKPTPAPEWNSGSARRGGLAEQRASACLSVSGWGFHPQPRRAPRTARFSAIAPPRNGIPGLPGQARRGGLAEQRASARLPRPGMEFRVCQVKPAEAGSPNNALQRGLPRPGMEFRVCQVKPAEAGSPNNALQRGLPRPGMKFRVCPPRRAPRTTRFSAVCLCQIPSPAEAGSPP